MCHYARSNLGNKAYYGHWGGVRRIWTAPLTTGKGPASRIKLGLGFFVAANTRDGLTREAIKAPRKPF